MSFVISPGVIQTPLTAGGVAYGTGTQAKVNSAGTTGQALLSAGASVPTWGSVGVAGGGTGQPSLTLNNVILGNGTNPVQFVAPGTSGNILTSNGTTWTSATPAAGSTVKTWTSFTASGSYTVPTGITSIRVYAFGSGGNGSTGASSGTGAGGGGGGCAFGDLAVTAGQVVTITISGGVATVSYASVTRFTANNGSNASGNTGGAGGSASIDVSVTNGGAYSGGTGGSNGGSGASSGSPLGNGYNGSSSNSCGGAGWGGTSASSRGGGGVGGAGSNGGGGAGGAAGAISPAESGGPSRDIWRAFSDPLLAACNAPGTLAGSINDSVYLTSAGPGGGGGGGYTASGNREVYAGSGGLGGGGGGADATTAGSRAYGGGSTFGGGGGSASGAFISVGGSPLYAGGGGGANLGSGVRTAGTGGAAIVLIYA